MLVQALIQTPDRERRVVDLVSPVKHRQDWTFNAAQALLRECLPSAKVSAWERIDRVFHLVLTDGTEVLIGPNARRHAGDLLWP